MLLPAAGTPRHEPAVALREDADPAGTGPAAAELREGPRVAPHQLVRQAPASLSTFGRAAIWYGKNDCPVFPLAVGKKVPLIPKDRGGNGCLDATTDLDQIERWWRQHPDANIGLACGSAFWVLDVDYGGWEATEPDGADTLVYLAKRYGKLPRTINQLTGGLGQQHFWLPDPRIRNGVKVLPGLDTRSHSGHVAAPPSLHPSGRHYRWTLGPDAAPLAPAPEWLVELLAPAPEPAPPQPAPRIGDLTRYATAALESACRTIETAGLGTQNATLNGQSFSIGQLVGGGVIPRGEARAALVAAGTRMASQQGRRPWTQGEIARLVDRALTSGATNPRVPEPPP